MCDEVGAEVRASGDDIQHSSRQTCAVGGRGQFERVEHRLRGRLEDDGAARSQSRGEFEHGQHLREVPRHDRAYDTDRLAPDDRAAGAADSCPPFLEGGGPDEGDVVPQQIDHTLAFGPGGHADRHAVLDRRQCRSVSGGLLEFVGEPFEEIGALPSASAPPRRASSGLLAPP